MITKIKAKVSYLSKEVWVAIDHELRVVIKKALGIQPDEQPETDSGRTISDGCSQGVLDDFFRPKKIAKFLKSSSKKWSKIWIEFIAWAEDALIAKRELHELDELRKRKDEGRLSPQYREDRWEELEKKYKTKPKKEKPEEFPEEDKDQNETPKPKPKKKKKVVKKKVAKKKKGKK